MDIDAIRPSTLKELAAVEQAHCVSILMPTHVAGSESRQDPIRLANLLDQVQCQLKERGLRRPEIEALLAPARARIGQASFWRAQGEALAIYLADGFSRTFRLADGVDEAVSVGPHFNIKPLLGALASSEPFYILALTKERARLYQGTRTELEEIQSELFPVSAADLVGIRESEPEREHHYGKPSPGSRGDRGFRSDTSPGNYHGHGAAELRLDADLMHFFKQVAERVATQLYDDATPLVMAADVSIFGWYRREHHRGNLIETDHVESPDALKPHELRERAWKIAAPALEADLAKLLDQFGTAAAAGKAAQGFDEVATAAAQGKVDTLFFDPRATRLGWLSDGGTAAHLVEATADNGAQADAPASSDGRGGAGNDAGNGQVLQVEELVNRAIIDTLRANGRAIPLAAARGRDGRDSAPQPPKAILRY